MKTVPAAMTWELLSHRRWSMLVAVLGAFAFPALTITTLLSFDAIDPADESMLGVHLVLSQISMAAFGVSAFGFQLPSNRLYAYPVRTSTLVAWRMIPSMVFVALEVVLCTVLLNAMFKLGWPLWGPALFLASAIAALQATVWLADRSLWVVALAAVVASAYGLWFKTRYGPMVGEPEKLWLEVTPSEFFTLIGGAGIAYAVAVFAVARNRRGEEPLSLGIVQWISRAFDTSPTKSTWFRGPHQAQAWMEWRRKGWMMPAIVIFGLIVGITLWTFASRDPRELIGGFVAGGGLLSAAAVVGGLGLGLLGPSDSDLDMGHFMATRPMTDADLASSVLRVTLKSVLVAWAIWAAAFALAVLGLLIAKALPTPLLPDGVDWRFWPATILGPCAVASLFASMALAGRAKLIVQILSTVLGGFIVVTLVSGLFLSRQAHAQLEAVLAAGVGAALVFITGSIYLAAHRRCLIRPATTIAAAVAFAAGATIIAAYWPTTGEGPKLPGYILLIGLLAIAHCPLAAAPLAVAWNRHR